MAKTRVGVLLRESVGGGKSTNRSADLVSLSGKYQEWCKQLTVLITALEKHREAMSNMHASRAAIVSSFAGMTKGTPMWECSGVMPSANRPSDSVCSYASIHDTLGAKTLGYAEKYKQFVIDYALEWQKVVTERVEAGLKKAELLRRDLDHYQKKVEAMRLSVNQAMAKGKSVKSDAQEKLRRNEEKLIGAKQSYNKAATDLCILMEEITERSWRDLHPLLIKVAQFDTTLSNDEAKILGSLNQVVSTLKQVAVTNGLSSQPRLKDLANLQPELLSTRPGGVAGLAIEYGGSSPTGPSNSPMSFDNQALSPGSVAPQGLGGFPVQIASSPASSMGPAVASDYQYNFDPPSTLSMLSLSNSSAPPPTLDDVYSANRSPFIQSAPTSANLPPLGPSSGTRDPPPRSSSFDGMYMTSPPPQRAPSFGGSDVDSAYSGYSGSYYSAAAPSPFAAPMPGGPPPLPPSAPPPPPPMTSAIALTSAPPSYGMSGGYNYGAPAPQQQPVSFGGNNTNPFGY